MCPAIRVSGAAGVRPRIFIGSSSESKKVARSLNSLLDAEADVTVWDQDFFALSRSAIEHLQAAAPTFDFAILIFAPDDRAEVRGKDYLTARDNVVLEAGLFMGHLGLERTFILRAKNLGEARIPTDLLGVTLVEFDAQRFQEQGTQALGPAVARILERVEALKPRKEQVFQRLGVGPEEIAKFYSQTGLTNVYRTREASKDDMLEDIRKAKRSVHMLARVYLSELLKDAERFTGAIADALDRSSPAEPEEFVVGFNATSSKEDGLLEELWNLEDPGQSEFQTLEAYRTHIERAHHHFRRRFDELKAVPSRAGGVRRRLCFLRHHVTRFVVPHSLLVIDERVVYVSFYNLSRARFGSFAPTFRLLDDGVDADTWAKAFLREHSQVWSDLSVEVERLEHRW